MSDEEDQMDVTSPVNALVPPPKRKKGIRYWITMILACLGSLQVTILSGGFLAQFFMNDVDFYCHIKEVPCVFLLMAYVICAGVSFTTFVCLPPLSWGMTLMISRNRRWVNEMTCIVCIVIFVCLTYLCTVLAWGLGYLVDGKPRMMNLVSATTGYLFAVMLMGLFTGVVVLARRVAECKSPK